MKSINVTSTMKNHNILTILICSLVFLARTASAAEQKPNPPNGKPQVVAVELTETGKALEAKYAGMLETLKADLVKQLPTIDQAKVDAWLAAIKAEEGPQKEATAKAKEVEKLQGAEARLRELEEQLKYAPQTLEDAQEDLARARARGEEDPEKMKVLQSAESFLKNRQKDIDKLKAGIEKAKKDVEEAKVKLPEAIKAAEAAKQAHDKALSATWKAMDALGANDLLSSSALDAKLAQYVIFKDATPRGLAEFAEKSPENQKLIEQLLADKDLMLQMLVNDGAEKGEYGQAMKIYTDILKASPKAKEGVFQRLAMAISLAHAVPIPRRDNDAFWLLKPEERKYLDPVQRYLNFEKWYVAGELHKGFKDLNVWNLRRVVDCIDPDEMLVWARQMLHTLRPECIPDDANTLVFVDVVDKEIAYGSGGVTNDLPDKHFMQNILANGGICGRRGFFCRFILQAFGVPAIERVEPGHSTVALWHPDGWQTRLGGGFGRSSFGYYSKMGGGGGGYGADVNFVFSSQAREDQAAYIKVKRAQWIASLMGEPWKPGLITYSGKTRGPTPPKPGEIVKPTFWSDLALHEQRRIIAGLESAKAKTSRAPEGAVKAPAATGKVTVDDKGVITIPSAACSSPTESKRNLYKGRQADLVVFVKNKAGDTLLHLSRYAKQGDTFEYTFNAPKAGKYQLAARVATPMPKHRLFVSANGGADVEMALPYTIGLWGKTPPVAIELKEGSNVLKFRGPARVTFGEFTLTPAK